MTFATLAAIYLGRKPIILKVHVGRDRKLGIKSSLGHDATSIARNNIARISFLASGMQLAGLAISIAASLLLLGWIMLRCRSGFDFTDEGFYLNWISDPWRFRSSVTQFGFVYYPLYKLVDGDIALLRQANVLILFVLGWALCLTLFRSTLIQRDSATKLPAGVVGVALVAGVGSLSFLDLWLPTPSYNSLTFQSLMLTVIGALLAGRELSKSSFAGWVLVGIGGGFAFLAKPPTAAMLACMAVLYLMAAGKFRIRGLLVAIAVAASLLALAAWAIDGSIPGLMRRIVNGIDIGGRLSAGHSLVEMFRWDGITLSSEQKFNFIRVVLLAFSATILGLFANILVRSASALIAIVISVACIATIAGLLNPWVSYEPFQPVQFVAVALGMALAELVFPFRTRRRLSRESVALLVFLAILPYAYAFGTNTNYWSAAARAGLFWFLAGGVICIAPATGNSTWWRLLPAAVIVLAVALGVLHSAMESPYRQTQPLRLQKSVVDIRPGKSRLFLPEDTAEYIRELHQLAAANGFMAGDPALDLTGVSPGSLYVMGARPLGSAWTPSGYRGSGDLLTVVLDSEACDAIVAAWILIEPGSPSLSPEILRRFGIDILADYRDVGSVNSTRSFAPLKFEHRLLKPTRSPEAARLACENVRPAPVNTRK